MTDEKFQKHEFELVEYPFTKETIEIDKQLVDLIQMIWTMNIETVSCCQGPIATRVALMYDDTEYFWIRFKTKRGIELFVAYLIDTLGFDETSVITVGKNLYMELNLKVLFTKKLWQTPIE